MKDKVSAWEPQARSLLRIMAGYMILLHALREVFGVMPPPKRGPGAFMALDKLGEFNLAGAQISAGGVVLLIVGILLLIGFFVRPAALILALQSAIAYVYAAMPRGPWPIRNGGMDALIYVLIMIYLAAAGPDAWSLDALLQKRKSTAAPA